MFTKYAFISIKKYFEAIIGKFSTTKIPSELLMMSTTDSEYYKNV